MGVKLHENDIDFNKVGQLLNSRIQNITTSERTTLGGTLGASHKGLIVFDTDLSRIFSWTGTVWEGGIDIPGNAATVTTNANLTGVVTSTGNATSLGSFTTAQLNTALFDNDIATGGGTATGTNTGDNAVNSLYSGIISNATHTGDVTGSAALTIVNNAVTNAKMATMPTKTYKGNTTGGTAAPTDVTVATMKTDLALNNVTNTSDANKPVSTAQQTALNLKANIASPTFTGTVGGITKAMVGLTNVDNTSDSTKNSATSTLTNKRITKRVTTEASSATPTINTNNTDIHKITALAVNITSMSTNLSGTPTDGQTLIIQITGTAARTITWGTSFESSTVTLPATTVTTARLDVGFLWNAATSKWRCVAIA